MKKVLLVLLLLIIAVAGFIWYKFSHTTHRDSGPKQQPIALQKHSTQFNTGVNNAMNAYYELTNTFVDGDSSKAKMQTLSFIKALDSIPLDELKKDSVVVMQTADDLFSSIKANAESIGKQTSLQEMRMDYRQVSEQLYSFLKAVNYEGANIYWQNCPMAFGEDNGANWLSRDKEIINPYLGKNHPEFKAQMLHCGETKDTIKTR